MEKYFVYLDDLRESREINMFGAVPYLQQAFPELADDRDRAKRILMAWMSFCEKSEVD